MGLLIDASVLIDAERGRLDILSKAQERQDQEFTVSVITASELLHAVWRATDAKTRTRRSAFVEALLERFPLIPIDLSTARLHAELWAALASKGLTVGVHDIWLAASCLAHGYAMATANVREFKRIPGLKVEQW